MSANISPCVRTFRSSHSDDEASRARNAGDARALGRRRLLVLTLNLATIAALIAVMAVVLGHEGWSAIDAAMLAAFSITLPWLSIGFWNALIGFVVSRLSPNPAAAVTPQLADVAAQAPVHYRTAIAMTVRNEDAPRAIARLRTIQRSLDMTPWGRFFQFHLLSDSSHESIVADEEREVARWRQEIAEPSRVHYRRRAINTGFKAGNLREFVERHGEDYEVFVPLDADSLMSAEAILRMVRVMQAHEEIGILQGLVVGMPSRSLFARVFQFGMRHGMRSYTVGGAWWQGDCGPYWGHNAAIRMRPFRDHCVLPVLPGGPPLGGHILSHDQVEAALMRRAGYEVRVIADEDESWEENPPNLLDFIKRDLRWCQGNMQYWRLLGLRGLKPVSRMQLLLAILMYLGAPGWIAFMLLGAAQLLAYDGAALESLGRFQFTLGLGLLLTLFTMSVMPKLMGLADALASRNTRRRYGGGRRLAAGSMLELAFSALIAPAVSLAQTLFLAGLAFGKRISWNGQSRVGRGLRFTEAARALWPQTLFGVFLFGVLAIHASPLLVWAAPVLASFLLAIPFSVATSTPRLGEWAERVGLCAIPEDMKPARTQALLAAVEDAPVGRAAPSESAARAEAA